MNRQSSTEFCPSLAGPGPSVQRGAASQKECSFSSLGDCTLHWNLAKLWLASSPRINFNGHFHSTVLDRNVCGFPAEKQKQRPSFHLAVYWPGRWKGWGLIPYESEKSRVNPRTGIPNLWDLMPDDLRWSWWNKNRNKVLNKCHALESSWNHPTPPSHTLAVCGKTVFHKTSPWCQKD